MTWKRERNVRWTKFSDVDPATVHLAYSSSQRGSKNMYASPCSDMTLLGLYYGELTDEDVNCMACLAREPDVESVRGD